MLDRLIFDARLRRAIAALALLVVVRDAGQAFALDGRGLAVLLATGVAAAGWTVWLSYWRPAAPVVVALALTAGAGGALTGLTAASAVFVFPFVAVIAAARMFPLAPAGLVTGAGILGVMATQVPLGKPVGEAFGIAAGLIAALLSGQSLREHRVRQEQAELLLARTRGAQEEQTRAAALTERARIAREIHDVLAHSLSALAVHLEGARLLLDSGAELDRSRLASQIDRAHRLAVEGLEETRRAVEALRGDALPLPELLDRLIGDPAGGAAALRVEGTPRVLPPEAGLAIFRTAQEALTNARRHAPAAVVELCLAYRPDRVTLSVADRRPVGAAAPPPAAAGGGYGLTGMRERAELLGGTLEAAPTDRGWRVELTVPA